MRVIAILATFNEERFIEGCLENLTREGLQVYLIDNGSTDRTMTLAEQYRDHGLIGVETFPRDGVFRWRAILKRKEAIAATLDADWFLHVDADEIHLPPSSFSTLVEALEEVDHKGFNAVNFWEYDFVPTIEAPDHDHPDYQKTMRWYYCWLPAFPFRLKAWKRQADPVELA